MKPTERIKRNRAALKALADARRKTEAELKRLAPELVKYVHAQLVPVLDAFREQLTGPDWKPAKDDEALPGRTEIADLLEPVTDGMEELLGTLRDTFADDMVQEIENWLTTDIEWLEKDDDEDDDDDDDEDE